MLRARPSRPGAIHLVSRSRSLTSRPTPGAAHLQALLDFLLSAHEHHRLRGVVLHAHGARLHRAPAAGRDGVRLHGRAERVRWRAARTSRQGARAAHRGPTWCLTGGRSLYEAKRSLHGNVHECPSSVDVRAFRAARAQPLPDPSDQHDIRVRESGSSASSTNGSIATLLAGDRRAQSGLALRDGRSGGEDSTTLTCPRSRTSTIWDPRHTTSCRSYIAGLGRRHAALRSK